MSNVNSNPQDAFKVDQVNPYTPSKEPLQPAISPYLKEYMNYMTAIFTGDASYFKKGAEQSLIDAGAGPDAIDSGSAFDSDESYQNSVELNKVKGLRPDMSNKVVAQVVDYISKIKVPEEDRQYLFKLGLRESGLVPDAVSGTHRGLYQFDDSTLKTIGMAPKDYDKNPINQFAAALALKEHNLSFLKEYLRYENRVFKGVHITKNGLAAAAHLLGAGTVKDWFDGTTHSSLAKKGFVDGNGTSIKEYFHLFA